MRANVSIAAPGALLRLRVSIDGRDPEIWRLLESRAELTLADLHSVLQIAFGWRESHLHAFTDQDPDERAPDLPRIGRQPRTWGMDNPLDDLPADQLSERKWTLGQVFDGFDGPLFYEYDFGDDVLLPSVYEALGTLQGLGVFVDGVEWKGVSVGGRAFARQMLRANVE